MCFWLAANLVREIPRWKITHKQTNYQTNHQQTKKQVRIHTNTCTNKPTNKSAHKLTNKPTHKQTINKLTNKQAKEQKSIQTNKQTNKRIDKQINKTIKNIKTCVLSFSGKKCLFRRKKKCRKFRVKDKSLTSKNFIEKLFWWKKFFRLFSSMFFFQKKTFSFFIKSGFLVSLVKVSSGELLWTLLTGYAFAP